MKFWAKVGFKEWENASELVSAFFKEFNPESSIVIQGKQGKVEIFFEDEPPIETIQAVQRCRVEEFYYGKVLGEYIQEENQLVEEGELEAVPQLEEVEEEVVTQPEEVEQEVVTQPEEVEQEAAIQIEVVSKQEEIPKQFETTQGKRRRKSNKKVESNHKEVAKKVEISELERISKKATSYEHFVKLVAEWLEMGKMQNVFENLVMVASELEKVTWNNLEAVLASKKNIIINKYHKICIGKQVSEKLNKYSIGTLPLINAMKQYKDYQFEQQSSAENPVIESVAEEVVVKEETPAQVEEVAEKKRVKMECMPEIIYFQEILGAVDKTQPIKDRVKYILNSMGLEKKDIQERQGIFEIANVAVTLQEVEWDTIFSKSSQPTEYLMNARMHFSNFINEFVSEYNQNTNVKVLTFLKQLQEIVMTESEKESLLNSAN